MKASLTEESSRNAIFNRKGGRQLILGTRIKYAKFHQYGVKKNKLPARPFFKVDQGLVNDWAKEMAKDVELAEKGSKKWRAR
jgi:phage gpG-like protein